nr:methyltransferase domain-containing protein [Allopusillimonas soli]
MMARPTLLFVHGWGFDSAFWQPLCDALSDWPQAMLDLGYFDGHAPQPDLPEGPLVCIGHSFGFMHALGLAPEQAVAWISINGFPRFSASQSFPEGVAPRLIQRMIRRMETHPAEVVDTFRQRCAAGPAMRKPNADTLRRDLLRLLNEDRRADLGSLGRPLLALASEDDEVVPPSMTRAAFEPALLRWHVDGGHLLPRSDAQWCALRIREFLRGLPDKVDRKRTISGRFAAAAGSYDAHARLQREVAGRLAQYIAALRLPPHPRILEVGCGTGLLTRALGGVFGKADWTITDIAPPMTRAASQRVALNGTVRFRILDGEHPQAFQDQEPDAEPGDYDLICSSMAIQWFDDVRAGLGRLGGMLTPGGHLAFALPLRGTFAEWRDAHARLGLAASTPAFPGLEDIQALTPGIENQIVETVMVQEHGSALAFLRGLRHVGATMPAAGSRPLSSAQLRQVCTQFDRMGARVSYRIGFGIWSKV